MASSACEFDTHNWEAIIHKMGVKSFFYVLVHLTFHTSGLNVSTVKYDIQK
jgi:hypothetical protein